MEKITHFFYIQWLGNLCIAENNRKCHLVQKHIVANDVLCFSNDIAIIANGMYSVWYAMDVGYINPRLWSEFEDKFKNIHKSFGVAETLTYHVNYAQESAIFQFD